jgi:serine/threonine-protein kinase
VKRQVPAVLGNLDVFEEIGHGGMGVVYRARQRLANREVAVKVLSGTLATRGGAEERFSGEIEALARLRHPNIVEVYEVGEDSGCVYFSMELVPGGTLAGRAKRQPIAPAEAAAIVEQLAAAVQTAHVLGLLHRDIKPANVLLTADDTPKLSDFGLAKWMDREDGLTETGAVLGTPSYMAPEQAVGSKHGTLGPPTDVYGLGATLYDLLTGRPPFRAASTFETLQQVIHEPPVPPRTLSPAVHPDLEAVCLKCLEKDPARRYATAQELANDLHRWRIGDPTRARPESRPRQVWRAVRRRSRLIGAIAALTAAVGIAIYVTIWAMPKPEGPPTNEELAEAVMKPLRDGKPATLLGETGEPTFQRWAVGVGEAGEQGAGKQFMVFALEAGLLELVPDSQTDRFRFSAEFRVEASVSGRSSAGVYFAHRKSVLGGGVAVDRAVVVDFTDNRLSGLPTFQLKGSQDGQPNIFDQATVRDVLYYVPPTIGGIKSEPMPVGSLRVVDPLDPAGSKKRDLIPWRQIVATVSPDEIRVEWRDPDGTYRPVGIQVNRKPPRPAIPTSMLRTQDQNYPAALQRIYPGIDTSGFKPYDSRGGVGLYVYDARVLFRNVVIEPLAPKAVP